MYKRVLLPTDFSLASELAAETAALEAQLHGAEVHLLYVMVTAPFAPVEKDPQTDQAQIEPEIQATIHGELERIRREKLSDISQVKLATAVARNAALGICDYAEQQQADLIIMAKRGRSGLSRTLIGGVTEKVVRHAPCAVLTFRTKAYE